MISSVDRDEPIDPFAHAPRPSAPAPSPRPRRRVTPCRSLSRPRVSQTHRPHFKFFFRRGGEGAGVAWGRGGRGGSWGVGEWVDGLVSIDPFAPAPLPLPPLPAPPPGLPHAAPFPPQGVTDSPDVISNF